MTGLRSGSVNTLDKARTWGRLRKQSIPKDYGDLIKKYIGTNFKGLTRCDQI